MQFGKGGLAEVDIHNYKFVSRYSVAPYNFVSLYNRCVYPYEKYEDLPSHNDINEDLFNGYIEYTIENNTPILVGSTEESGNGKVKTFFKNSEGKYAIPGNTVRGFIRNNAAILSMSSLENYISDKRFYFRSFGKDKSAKDYRTRLDIGPIEVNGRRFSAPKNIHGGYIYKKNNDTYVIVPPIKVQGSDRSYFVISEQHLRRINPNVKINYMYSREILDLINNKSKYSGEEGRKIKKEFLKSIREKTYKPYCTEISFEISNSRTVTHIGKPHVYKNEGYIMSSDFIQGKLAHYIIPKPDFNGQAIELSRENEMYKYIDYYKDELLRTKKKIHPDRDDKNDKRYFFLPEQEGKDYGKPLFYGQYNNEIYLGFSPYLRITYDKSIKDLIPKMYKHFCENKYSYVDSLFGFSNMGEDKHSYKSRLSFQDAVCVNNAQEDKEYTYILGQPHASACNLYLKQGIEAKGKEIKNYNDDGVIRGIKQYLLKSYTDTEFCDKSKSVASTFIPLKKHAKFVGRIYYKNLTQEELGLVLWSLKVSDDANETVGYGKPFGFGNVTVKDIKVFNENLKIKYSSMNTDYMEMLDYKKLIKAYKDYFKRRFNINIEEQKPVKELITLKTLVVDRANENNARHMMIQFPGNRKNEFAQALPLPEANNLVKTWSGAAKDEKKGSFKFNGIDLTGYKFR